VGVSSLPRARLLGGDRLELVVLGEVSKAIAASTDKIAPPN
jgi:hypothetical protein